MHLFITGGTGLIGTALINHIIAQRPETHMTVYTHSIRSVPKIYHNQITYTTQLPEKNLDSFDVVINLAGEPIINKRWNKKQKYQICQSRWQLTEQLVKRAKAGEAPPSIWLNASATGIYNDSNDKTTEESPINRDKHIQSFTQLVCQKWEQITEQLDTQQTRVCLLRTGIVLSLNGGMLSKLITPFKLGLGTILGKGTQYIPWIHIEDHISAILYLIDQPEIKGPVNLCAPTPVTQKEFSETLAKTLKRPLWFKAPRQLLQLILGEASELLFSSQNIDPKVLLEHRFEFKYRSLNLALTDLLNQKQA